MNNQESTKEINLSLDAFLQAVNAEDADDALTFLVEKQIEPLVKKFCAANFTFRCGLMMNICRIRTRSNCPAKLKP